MIELIIGKSGSGKDTYAIAKRYRPVVSHTTRKPRPSETDGIDKHFHTSTTYEYESAVAKTFFDGNYYWVGDSDFQGKDCFVVDLEGIKQLAKSYGHQFKNYFSITYMYQNNCVLLKRLIIRDGIKKAIKRFIHDMNLFNVNDLQKIANQTGCTFKIVKNFKRNNETFN